MPHKLIGDLKIYIASALPLGSWGWSSHSNMCSNTPHLDLYFSVKNKYSEIISPVDIVHIGAKTDV